MIAADLNAFLIAMNFFYIFWNWCICFSDLNGPYGLPAGLSVDSKCVIDAYLFPLATCADEF